MTMKKATDIKPGDKVILLESGEVVTVKSVSPGAIKGHISLEHKAGWSEVRKTAMIEVKD